MAVNEIPKQPKFCWLCYQESVMRFARELPSRTLREAVFAAAREHKGDGGLVPALSEHARHPGAERLRRRLALTSAADEEAAS